MLRETEFVELSNLLGEGFFADRVVSLLQKPSTLNSTNEEVLIRVQSFLEKVLEGQEQVGSSCLSGNAIESIDAYQRAIIVFQQALTQKSEAITIFKFKDLISKMKDEISRALEKKVVVPEEVKTTLDFFRYVRRETILESSEYFSQRVVLKWPKRLTFYLV